MEDGGGWQGIEGGMGDWRIVEDGGGWQGMGGCSSRYTLRARAAHPTCGRHRVLQWGGTGRTLAKLTSTFYRAYS